MLRKVFCFNDSSVIPFFSSCVPRVVLRGRRAVEADSDIAVEYDIALNSSKPLPGSSNNVSTAEELSLAINNTIEDVKNEAIVINGAPANIIEVVAPVLVTGL